MEGKSNRSHTRRGLVRLGQGKSFKGNLAEGATPHTPFL